MKRLTTLVMTLLATIAIGANSNIMHLTLEETWLKSHCSIKTCLL